MRDAIAQGDQDGVLWATLVFFAGADLLDRIPPEARNALARNLPESEAIAFASDAFAAPRREEVGRIQAPVLLITADETLRLLRPINDELERLLPRAVRVRIPDAGHELWETHPEVARRATAEFLARQ